MRSLLVGAGELCQPSVALLLDQRAQKTRSDARGHLDHFAVLKGIAGRRARKEVVEALLRQTNLWEGRWQKLGGYSGGMRQRFGVAVALLGNPKLMIVDEPTAGLDPAERVRFLNLLSELGENSVVLLSTHIVEDVYFSTMAGHHGQRRRQQQAREQRDDA